MSSSLQTLLRSLGEARLRQVPSWAMQNINKERLTTILSEAATSYGRKYFNKGKGAPVAHVMIALGLIGYAIEYPHLKESQRQRKYH
ncbi:hypothetical protein PTSG_12889 [Salpingoeca rosetta]|uniref:Uncharacterized protein n=1 Tax=Salpingoeca rosetta (strain ATCC 50818 / BSB-021) TaxID=946362 RepID=F2UMP9_SALR5|nr:uncharacterized protein PTSG_12889 [Salpingoeca rosetta]EGD78398.1 hypothetical protein PTSG_12889 [Salpingoeca rosetta]|eukprot:XP_004989721.1 hypothetical protein PTSG_12889 [Salpingoeca rosetta]